MSPIDSEKPALRQSLEDDALRGIELAATPVVFGGIGWLLDGWLGSGPWATIGLAAFAFVGVVLRMWFTYDNDMAELERASRWTRRADRVHGHEADDDIWSRRRGVGA